MQPNEIFDYQKEDRPAAEGMTVFSPMLNQIIEPGRVERVTLPAVRANDGRQTDLYLPDGSELIIGRIIHAVRTKSHEEVIEAQTLRYTRLTLWVFLAATIVLQVADWILRYFKIL